MSDIEITNFDSSANTSGDGVFSKIVNSLRSVKGMKGVFTVILTAAILAIFEMVFFYKIVAPTVKDEMNTNIGKVGDQLAQNLNDNNRHTQQQSPASDVAVSRSMRFVFNDITAGTLDTSAARENILIEAINQYTIYTGVVIVLVLLIVLYIIWRKIKTAVETGQDDEDSDMLHATLSALLTVGVLIAFQIMFFFYGKQYRYPGTAGNEELLWVIIGSINPSDNNTKQIKVKS